MRGSELHKDEAELRNLNRRLQEKVQQLKEAHDDLANFFTSTEMATLFLDEDLCIKRFTPFVKSYGVNAEDKGRCVGSIQVPILQHGLEEDARKVLRGDSVAPRNIRLNGRWITRRVLPYRTGDLCIEGVVVTLVDISDLKQTEEALRESESRFREMADGLPQLVWVHGPEGEQELVNQTYCEFFGVDRREMKGERWQALVHPDDRQNYERAFERCMESHDTFHAQTRVRRADGKWRWLDSWGKPRFTDSGRFKGFVGSSTDITEQRAIQEALRESEERFRMLADNIDQLAWMADKEGHIFWFNRRWLDFTGTTPEQMSELGWAQIPHPDYLQQVERKYFGSIRSGEPWEDIFPMRRKDGEYRWFLSRALPMRDDNGEIVRWLGTNTDITEQREVEELLRESDRRKDEYLAMLGHELRNPLAAISAATQLAKMSGSADLNVQRAVEVLERQSNHVAQIVDGLLEVSRISRGKIQLERVPINMVEVLDCVLQDRLPHVAKRGLRLQREYGDKPVWVAGDWVRLIQIFDNLLGNAIKFTQSSGTITVSLREETGKAYVSIRDTGVGIRQEMLSRIFEPFLQEVQDVARAAGGLGLGLSLAKSLAELHEGGIEARSEGAGKGAEFLVNLPLSSPASAREAAARINGAQRRVIIVEDNNDTAVTLATLLELKGHRVKTAANASEALALLQSEGADVILCDIGLPGMNGYEFARAVRADDRLCHIPMVATTGYGQPEDRKRSFQAGFDDHVTKPLSMDQLEQIIERAEMVRH